MRKILFLQKGIGIALTTDGGTGHTGKVQAITIHWIDENFEYGSALLDLASLRDVRTTIPELARILERVLAAFDIDKLDATVVADNAANIQGACREIGLPTERCSCHSSQLDVVKALTAPDIKVLMDKVRNGVLQIRGKGLLNTYFKQLQSNYCTNFISSYFSAEFVVLLPVLFSCPFL